MKTLLLSLIAGCLFGTGLTLSGMTDPRRIVDFLDVTGDWDPTLMFVMGGALSVFISGRMILKKRNPAFCCSSGPISKSLIIGAVVFGVGWGIGGICPGPGIANLGALRPEALIFVPTMAVGMVVARLFLGRDT